MLIILALVGGLLDLGLIFGLGGINTAALYASPSGVAFVVLLQGVFVGALALEKGAYKTGLALIVPFLTLIGAALVKGGANNLDKIFLEVIKHI